MDTQRKKFSLKALPRAVVAAFALAIIIYMLLSFGALFLFGSDSVFSIESGRWLFGLIFVISIPISIQFMNRK
jgi:hypothetical protein